MSSVVTAPRKLPRQRRSQATVSRLIDAAARILVADGYEAASTNRIAAEAGISPGSLYQYFPNKDAIVVAAVERMTGRMASRFIDAVAHPTEERVEDTIRNVISALLAAMEHDRELVRAVVEQLPRLGGSVQVLAFERRIIDLATGYLTALSDAADRQRVTTTVWIAVQSVEQLTIRYVLDRPPIPREVFVSELQRLVLGYANGAPMYEAGERRLG
jgi:AcrR family transcriptional regulator